jgi:hypothetical protein
MTNHNRPIQFHIIVNFKNNNFFKEQLSGSFFFEQSSFMRFIL